MEVSTPIPRLPFIHTTSYMVFWLFPMNIRLTPGDDVPKNCPSILPRTVAIDISSLVGLSSFLFGNFRGICRIPFNLHPESFSIRDQFNRTMDICAQYGSTHELTK